ncbi:GNAT family N-acetyltransferase [Halalkalibacter akibai]|uniref:Acetyltransferase n=1 Tax=Halalkalibacter akibai (strain ATCC 43226 / DSM 21942 / CIP 109018 / JCM 9157 / 1139) TaxID=1236973 RepID=W4QSU1_HALA3|nr:GNAT family N-acetyltransferase [Halalkalibacter akibai]GAE35166.1 acetyltransferase [Halalkalibacter akibai JCM 9157]
MTVIYQSYIGIPEPEVLKGIADLHHRIFNQSENFLLKIQTKPELLFFVAIDPEQRVIGFKVGYAVNNSCFYSWLGGVDEHYRSAGIGSTLMLKQHAYLKENGYKTVQTKTMNKWRNMLILNIKLGFNVVSTYTDEKGLHKIILEKSL